MELKKIKLPNGYSVIANNQNQFLMTCHLPEYKFLDNTEDNEKKIMEYCIHEESYIDKKFNDIKVLNDIIEQMKIDKSLENFEVIEKITI